MGPHGRIAAGSFAISPAHWVMLGNHAQGMQCLRESLAAAEQHLETSGQRYAEPHLHQESTTLLQRIESFGTKFVS